MIFRETRLSGAFIIEMERRIDFRGSFARAWCAEEFRSHGLSVAMVQGNTAHSRSKGTIRGMHLQRAPFEEAKLIRCIRGSVYDVIVDLRPQSNTFRQWIAIELDETSNMMVYVPEGFAHGYQTLRDNSEVFYLVSQFYAPDYEMGFRYNDPAFNITWPYVEKVIISEKDKTWPDFPA